MNWPMVSYYNWKILLLRQILSLGLTILGLEFGGYSEPLSVRMSLELEWGGDQRMRSGFRLSSVTNSLY